MGKCPNIQVSVKSVENNFTPIFVPFKFTRNVLGKFFFQKCPYFDEGGRGEKFKNVPNLNVPFYGRGRGRLKKG